MGFYKQREDYFRGLAAAHPQVQHHQPAGFDDATPRESFFRINEQDELEAACKNWAHFPCIVQLDISGSDVNRDGLIRQRNVNTLLFLQKLELDPANPVEADAITNAYDIAFDVMQDFKTSIADEFEENDSCGVFGYMEPAFGTWQRYGPVGDELYGWLFSFTDETKRYKPKPPVLAGGAVIVDDEGRAITGMDSDGDNYLIQAAANPDDVRAIITDDEGKAITGVDENNNVNTIGS